MTAYSKAVSTLLTGINTIIADGQISANSPLCPVTILHMLAGMAPVIKTYMLLCDIRYLFMQLPTDIY